METGSGSSWKIKQCEGVRNLCIQRHYSWKSNISSLGSKGTWSLWEAEEAGVDRESYSFIPLSLFTSESCVPFGQDRMFESWRGTYLSYGLFGQQPFMLKPESLRSLKWQLQPEVCHQKPCLSFRVLIIAVYHVFYSEKHSSLVGDKCWINTILCQDNNSRVSYFMGPTSFQQQQLLLAYWCKNAPCTISSSIFHRSLRWNSQEI